MKNVIALIQVRMGSSRVPGKALVQLCGRELLGHILDRIRASSLVDDLVVATSVLEGDDRIEDFCHVEKVHCVRGSEVDVCERMNMAVERYPAHHYLRFCGDAPMQDRTIIDEVIKLHLDSGADYTTNGIEETRTFPLGVDVRIAKRSLFTQSLNERDEALKLMENPLAYVHEHLSKYKHSLVEARGVLKRPELRFIADYCEDVEILQDVFTELYPANPLFGCEPAIHYIDSNPDIRQLMNTVKDHLKKRLSSTSSDASYLQKCT